MFDYLLRSLIGAFVIVTAIYAHYRMGWLDRYRREWIAEKVVATSVLCIGSAALWGVSYVCFLLGSYIVP